MDREQARFILQSFRPDGADAKDPDFAEALAVAAEDRELGDWLSAERAQDAAFAAALGELSIPEELRDSILSVLEGEGEDESFGEMDSSFIGALASVRPPEGLREQILTAMNVESSSESVVADFPEEEIPAPREEITETRSRVRGWMKSAAVAAALVMGAFVGIELTSNEKGSAGGIPISAVEHTSIQHVASASPLEHRGGDIVDLNKFLSSKNIPTVSLQDLPRGLVASDAKPVGCALLKLGEKNASLVCFDKHGQLVHLVVVNREDIEEKDLANLTTLAKGGGTCWQCPASKVSVATWGDDKRAFLLLGETDPDELRKEFF